MTTKKTAPTGPCPPVVETDEDMEDNVLSEEKDADFDAEEQDA